MSCHENYTTILTKVVCSSRVLIISKEAKRKKKKQELVQLCRIQKLRSVKAHRLELVVVTATTETYEKAIDRFCTFRKNKRRYGPIHRLETLRASVEWIFLSLARRAIQSTGTKSAKVKGWRRKMVLLMCSSASRVLTSASIELLSDTTSSCCATARSRNEKKKKREKCFLTKENKNHKIFPENILWKIYIYI